MTEWRGEDVQAAYYCAAEVMRSRVRLGHPIPVWLRRHYARLDAAVVAGVSDSRHESDSGAEELDQDDLITAQEAAGMLGISKRQAQRIAADLDGTIGTGRWLFRRKTVAEYAEAMKQ